MINILYENFDNIKEIMLGFTVEQKQDLINTLTKNINTPIVKTPNCCSECGSISFIKHGLKDNRQRYKCKDCLKTFSDTNNTLLYRSRLSPDTLQSLILHTIQGDSLSTIAKEIGISQTSAFFNRHKLLSAISVNKPIFNGLTQSDEFFTPLSFKGKRDLGFFLNELGRLPRHNRNYWENVEHLIKNGFNPADYKHLLEDKKRKRGISNEQVCVLTCVNDNKKTFALPVTTGKIKSEHLETALKDKVNEKTILVTDSEIAYRKFCEKNEVHLEQIPSGEHTRGAFNLANVNSFHSRLEFFLNGYRQVSSKYLERYVGLFEYLDKTRKQKNINRVKTISEMLYDANPLTLRELNNKQFCFDTKGLLVA